MTQKEMEKNWEVITTLQAKVHIAIIIPSQNTSALAENLNTITNTAELNKIQKSHFADINDHATSLLKIVSRRGITKHAGNFSEALNSALI